MTSNFVSFAERAKKSVTIVHDWSRIAQSPALDGAILPKVVIEAQGGGRYDLTLDVVSRLVGECYEIYRRGVESGVAITAADEQIVAGLVNDIVGHRQMTVWTGGVYHESDLLAIIERVFLDKNHTALATILVQRMFGAKRVGRAESSVRLRRRSGDIVAWNSEKVELSVGKALVAAGLGSKHSGFPARVADEVTARINVGGQSHVTTEEVQSIVEQVMVQVWATHTPGDQTLFGAIRGYMTYRSERAAQRRQAEEAEASRSEADRMLDSLPGMFQATQITVVEKDGSATLWDGEDLRSRIKFAAQGLDLILNSAEIEEALRASLFDGMKRSDIAVTVNLNSKTLIEKDADFAKFAGRIQLSYIYEEVLGWDILRDGIKGIRRLHREKFAGYIERGIAIKRISPKAMAYDLFALADALLPDNDLGFDFLGMQTLYDRYLIVDKTSEKHRRLETPQFFWMRVSMGLFLGEKDLNQRAQEYYRMLSERRFCPSTPTLFNSMTLHSQLSSCYLYKVDDSLESIFGRGISENAQLSKWAGGLGGSWTSVRGTGAYISGTNGESQGVIPFLKIHNDQLVAVNQGGKRKGSGCAYLETWHNDILEFLDLRKNVGDDRRRTHDMNTANWVPDLFMKRMEARQTWTLFRSCDVPDLHETYGKKFEERYTHYEQMVKDGKLHGDTMPALDLWKKMLSMLFETGHPWITFKDPCNVRSPQDHAGVIHSSNLCTEITLNTSKEETAVCNLGSVLICNHLNGDGSLDLKKLRETVRMAMRGLDNVIDLNFYPTEAAKTSNMRHRPVGMGVMGLTEALYMKNIPFASDAAVEFNDEFMEAIAYYAYEASSDLAAERGAYSSFKGSKWDRGIFPQDTIDLLEQERGLPINVVRGGKMDWTPLRAKIASQGMRNSNCIAIAPTATISNITGCSPCIEPTFKNLFVKSNLSGDFTVLNPFLVKDLKARGLWTKEVSDSIKYYDGDLTEVSAIPADLKEKYRTAFDIDHKWVVAAAARRQKWIDQAQSLNFWLKTPDIKLLSHLYRDLWHSGAKTSYYLRTQAASGIEKATVSVKKQVRGVAGGEAALNTETTPPIPVPPAQPKRVFSAEEKTACSIEAMKNGEECQACQ